MIKDNYPYHNYFSKNLLRLELLMYFVVDVWPSCWASKSPFNDGGEAIRIQTEAFGVGSSHPRGILRFMYFIFQAVLSEYDMKIFFKLTSCTQFLIKGIFLNDTKLESGFVNYKMLLGVLLRFASDKTNYNEFLILRERDIMISSFGYFCFRIDFSRSWLSIKALYLFSK